MTVIRTSLFAVAAGVFLALAGATTAEIAFKGGDGTSPDTAVIILGAEGSPDGIDAEYSWIETYRTGAEVPGQALIQKGERMYDVLTIRIGGRDEEIFFDIIEFFGNF
jgi:hypothetical protein